MKKTVAFGLEPPAPKASYFPAGMPVDDNLLDRYIVPTGPGLYRRRATDGVNRALHFPFGSETFNQWVYPWIDEPSNPQYLVLLVDARPFLLNWSVGAFEYKLLYNEKICGMVQIIPQTPEMRMYKEHPFLIFYEKVKTPCTPGSPTT